MVICRFYLNMYDELNLMLLSDFIGIVFGNMLTDVNLIIYRLNVKPSNQIPRQVFWLCAVSFTCNFKLIVIGASPTI